MYRFWYEYVGDWIEVFPFYEGNGSTRSFDSDLKIARDKFDGQLIFKDSDYDTIYGFSITNLEKLYFRFQIDSGIYHYGYLNLKGTYNTIVKECSLTLEIYDRYSKLLSYQDVNYDIIKGIAGTDIVACRVESEWNLLEFSVNVSLPQMSLWKQYQIGGDVTQTNIYAREKAVFKNALADELIEAGSWYLLTTNTDGTKTLIRDWTISGDYNPSPVVTVDYTFFVSWTGDFPAVNALFYGNSTDTGFIDVLLQYAGTDVYGRKIGVWYENYYGNKSFLYTRLRRLDTVIQWLIEQSDNTILFNSNSFKYFNDNEDLANILIAGITDIILNPTKTAQQDEPSTRGLLSFKSVMDCFNGYPFQIYWYIDNNNYFRMRHITEIQYTLGADPQYDLQTYKGKDWSIDKGTFNYDDSKRFGKLVLKNTAQNTDFQDKTITISSLKEIFKNSLEKTFQTFYFDIWDIQNFPSRYPNESTEQFALLSCDRGNDTQLITSFTNHSLKPFAALTLSGSKSVTRATATVGQLSVFYSNSFQVIENLTYKVQLTYFDLFGASPAPSMALGVDDPTGFTAKSNAEIISEASPVSGIKTYYLKAAVTGMVRLIIYKTADAVASDFKINDTDGYLDSYTCRKSIGQYSGRSVMNADLSLSNVLENHGKYEFPATTVEIEGVSTIVATAKLKQTETMLVPIYDTDLIDFDYLVNCILGNNIQPESLSVKFDRSFAQFKGRF